MKLGIVGGGRAAWAFGSAWIATGGQLTGVATRSAGEFHRLLGVSRLSLDEVSNQSEIVLVAVTDSALPEIAAAVSKQIPAGVLAFHPSGSLSSEVFSPHLLAFSLHPLRSLPAVGEPVDLSTTLFTFEGNPEVRDRIRDWVGKVGGRFAEIPKERKPLYHAAAVFASNHLAALLEIARDLIRQSGVEADVNHEISRLAQSAIDNWLRGEITGPAARGDKRVIDRHLAALAHHSDRAELYRLLTLELAKALQAKRF